jgi:hypothetical protein
MRPPATRTIAAAAASSLPLAARGCCLERSIPMTADGCVRVNPEGVHVTWGRIALRVDRPRPISSISAPAQADHRVSECRGSVLRGRCFADTERMISFPRPATGRGARA